MSEGTDSGGLLGEAPQAVETGNTGEVSAAETPQLRPLEGDLSQWALPSDALGGKYKTVADLASGYSEASRKAQELGTKLKGFTGAPVDEFGKPAPYSFEPPEGMEWAKPEDGDPLMDKAQAFFRENNVSGDLAQGLFALGAEWANEMVNRYDAKSEEEEAAKLAERFGGSEQAAAATKELLGVMLGALGKDREAEIREHLDSDARIGLFYDFMKSVQRRTLPTDGTPITGSLSEEQYQKILATPNYENDPALVAKVMAHAAEKAARM